MTLMSLANGIVFLLLGVSYAVGMANLLLELLVLRRPYIEDGLNRPAVRAWRLSGASLLGLTAALTLNFWAQAERTGSWRMWPAFTAWALIVWLVCIVYRRSRFQLTLTRRQLVALCAMALAFYGIASWFLIQFLRVA